VIWVDNLGQWILARLRLQRVIWLRLRAIWVDNLGQWILARLRLRVIWPATVEWVLSVMPLVDLLVTQVLLRRRLMLLMPLSALQWTEPPPKVARLVPMQVPHKQMTMGRVLQLKKL